jgi:Zn-dependent M28 family amino/carboxypeptidase
MTRTPWIVLLLLAIAVAVLPAQEREDRTLLSHKEMRAIINEASGERAQHAVLEMVPYPRVRARSEYEARFRETEAVVRIAREAGFSNVEVESFPSPGRTWHANRAELWMVEPSQDKLYDTNDVLVSVAAGSESGDVTAPLVDVGTGARPEDYAGKDVAGKIVLGMAGANQLQRLAVFERGAVGVISYNALRADDFPDQLMSQSVASMAPQGKKVGFGWSIAPRVGRDLAAHLARGEKVVLRSVISAETFAGEMEMVHATIPGDGSSDQAIMVSAHLYEGYTKQGANDDNSGCALTLEMGRAYLRLVKAGALPTPKRTIHFLWVPEISGSMAWLNAHPDVKQKLIADLNFDMEGLNLKLSGSTWVMHRTPDSLPTFLNDLCASVLKYVADLNRERVRYRSVAYGFTLPVVAPTGSRDPFFVTEDAYYGASDHVVFIGQGIPAIMFITWPDHFYHSSQDTPERLDPTQFKRAAVVGIASMGLVASAGDETALKITAESLARGAERMGISQKKGLSYMADLPFGLTLPEAYREARVAIRHQAAVEKAVVKSAATLFADPAAAAKKLTPFDALIDQRAAALQNEAAALFALRAEQLKVPATEPAATDLEKLAARTVVEPAAQAGGPGAGMFGGGRGQGAPDTPLAAARRKIPGHITGELAAVLRQKRTVLEVRDFISGEFEPVPLQDVFDYVKALAAAGQAKLTETPEPAAKGKGKAPAARKER